MKKLIKASQIYTKSGQILQNGYVLVENGKITYVGDKRPEITGMYEFCQCPKGCVLSPGFIDTHVHGLKGYDVMTASESGLKEMCLNQLQCGVTTFYPTKMTESETSIKAALENVALVKSAMESTGERLSRSIAGIHLEGPFVDADKKGAQPEEYIKTQDANLFGIFQACAKGLIKIVTFSPNVSRQPDTPCNTDFIENLCEGGVVPSIGHTSASNEVGEWALKQVKKNPRRATHYSNAMPKSTLPSVKTGKTEPTVADAILNDPETPIELIVDGIHVQPEDMKYLFKVKGADGIILITDGISARGKGNGVFLLGNTRVTVKDGVARLYAPSSGKLEDVDENAFQQAPLAGSVVFMHQAVNNMRIFAGATLGQALQMATENPAKNVGLTDVGTIELGKLADFVVLDPETLQPRATLIGGEFVWTDGSEFTFEKKQNMPSIVYPFFKCGAQVSQGSCSTGTMITSQGLELTIRSSS